MPLETVARTVLLPVLLALAACGYKGPAVAGYPGLQNQIQWYYDSNALEQNATCTQPRMRSVTGAQVIGETPEQVVMNIRYYWLDEGQIDRDPAAACCSRAAASSAATVSPSGPSPSPR